MRAWLSYVHISRWHQFITSDTAIWGPVQLTTSIHEIPCTKTGQPTFDQSVIINVEMQVQVRCTMLLLYRHKRTISFA